MIVKAMMKTLLERKKKTRIKPWLSIGQEQSPKAAMPLGSPCILLSYRCTQGGQQSRRADARRSKDKLNYLALMVEL